MSDKKQINQTKKICKGCRRIAALSKKKKDKSTRRFHYVPLKCLFEIDLFECIRVHLNMLFEKFCLSK